MFVMSELYLRIYGDVYFANYRFGRIPEPEDIIGSVLVQNGELQAETYQPMPTYRLVTREGPMKLSSYLLERLREKLKSMEKDT
jgi:hypothetical protein